MKKVLIIIGSVAVAVALAITIIVCVGNNGKNNDSGANNEESFTEWYETDEIVFPEIDW
jgi:flagellar basal body-associated protein FliL